MTIPSVNGRSAPRSRALGDDDVLEPPSATGQYPDAIWADAPSAAATALADDDVPEPESPTGQYPDELWMPASSAQALEADDDVPEPATATGQYPDDVWAAPPASASALTDEAPPAAVPAPSAGAPDHLKEPGYSDELPELPGSLESELPPELTLQEMYRIVRTVGVSDSGEALYSAVSTDADYAGLEAGYRGRRFGLAFGLLLFTQESGRLGSVLRLAERRDPQAFEDAFGADARELLAVTGSETVAERLSFVGGRPLDDPGWVSRFRAAGAREELRNAQNEEAIAHLLRPLVPWALALGLDTPLGLAFALDRAVTCGLGGGVRWLIQASGLLRDPAGMGAALRHLGHAELRDFQASTRLLAPTGRPDTATMAALLVRLRLHGGWPLPPASEVRGRLVAAAQGAARRRLERLNRSGALSDDTFPTR